MSTILLEYADTICKASSFLKQSSKEKLLAIHSLLQPASFADEHNDKLTGSCQWIEEREDFTDWRHSTLDVDKGADREPFVYWVNANPGAGKTVLATHVATLLQECRLQCSTHFFHFGKKASHSLAMCLRSIAYQMATTNSTIRDALGKLQSAGCVLDLDDARSVWLKIFKACIFQVRLTAEFKHKLKLT